MGEALIVRRGFAIVSNNLNFYDNGNEFVATTGGWVVGLSSNTGEASKQASYIHLRATSLIADAPSSVRTYVTDIKVDLTNIRKLYFDIKYATNNATTNTSGNMAVSNTKDDIAWVARVQLINNSSNILELDVSSLTGAYYIKCFVSSTFDNGNYSDLEIYRIWGAK